MIGERELELLSAYSDGELPPEQRPLVEKLLNEYPHLSEALKEFRRLKDAACGEAIPDLPGESEHWDATRQACGEAVAPEQRQTIKRVAARDNAPFIESLQFEKVWSRIQARTVLNPRLSRRAAKSEAAPHVRSNRWNAVWESITGQTKPATPVTALKARYATGSSLWIFLTAAGLAAGLLLMLLSHLATFRPSPLMTLERSGELTGLNATASMSTPVFEVPDALDDRYGVAVKYNPGDKDPVIHLYLKNLNDSEVRSTESAVPAQ